MKSIIMAAALCISSFTLCAQSILTKEIKVQDLSNVKKITLDCNTVFIEPRAEYKPFVDFMKNVQMPGPFVLNELNFLIKYTMVVASDKAIRDKFSTTNTESLNADFRSHELNCNSIVGKSIPFTDLNYNSETYNVSLNTSIGLLTFTNIGTGKAKRFTLTPIGDGIYFGSVSGTIGPVNYTEAVLETVVVVLNRVRRAIH